MIAALYHGASGLVWCPRMVCEGRDAFIDRVVVGVVAVVVMECEWYRRIVVMVVVR